LGGVVKRFKPSIPPSFGETIPKDLKIKREKAKKRLILEGR
jgi:hypothetical protein